MYGCLKVNNFSTTFGIVKFFSEYWVDTCTYVCVYAEAVAEVDESLSGKANTRRKKGGKKLFHSRKLSCAETDFTLAPFLLFSND